jgi:molybdate transport system ATP-binding protein
MKLERVSVRLNKQLIIKDLSWSISSDQAWAILGTNACGKSTLGRLIAGEHSEFTGAFESPFEQVIWLSLESQQELYERELYRDDTDFMDQLDEGTPVKALLEEITPWDEHSASISQRLKLEHLLNRGYRSLSTGEGRRVMLARALLAKPDYLILDEPFEGLDAASREDLHKVIDALIADGQGLLMLVNQQADLADNVTHLALMDKGEFLFSGERPQDLGTQWQHLLTLKSQNITLPERQSDFQLPNWPDNSPLVQLTDGFVQYDETFQFQQLNWSLMPGQHTHIAGPNGCGKSTLLGLITGDHPQCYRNDLKVLGFKRGQGESIWQIKKHLGYVSGSLHRDYRVSGNVLTAVVSGLTDSIGVYQAIGETEKRLALSWLTLIGLHDKWNLPFKQLSMGEQRLVLIARSLIKQPPLLILDEPTQGLDDFNRFYVLSIVEKILAAGPTTLLFVSHRQDEVMSCIKNRLTFNASNQESVLFDIGESVVVHNS